MSKPEISLRRVISVALKYGWAISFVAISTFLTHLLDSYNQFRSALFFPAIVLSAWYGGTGPGLFAVLLSTLSLGFFFLYPRSEFTLLNAVPYLVVFVVTAWIISWWSLVRKRIEGQLRIEIGERKLAADALRRGEAYLSEAQRLSHTGSFGWDISSGEIYWSLETFRIFGYEPTTKPSVELVLERTHPEDRLVVQRVIDRASRERKDFDFERRLLMPDGSVKYLQVVAHALDNPSGNVEFVGAVMDITEQKRAQEALEKAQAELAHVARVATLGEMTASIAHEINQPLGAIANSASACLRWLEAQKIKEARQSAARVIAESRRASEIIERIRELAKKAPPRKDWLDVNETIHEAIALVQSGARRNGVMVQTQLSDDVPLILADRIQLQQVILNLMMNAIEAMTGAGAGPRELLIRSGLDESQQLLVSVQDSGPGLD